MLSCSWTFLRLEGFFFRDIHKTQFEEGVWANWATEYKIGGGKIYSHTNTFGAKYTIRVTRWHSKYKILNYIMKHNFCLSDLLTKSNRTTLQSYKVEERTFGTPCKTNILTYLYYELYIVFIFVLEIYASVNSTCARPPPPTGLLRSICTPCQSGGWGICKFCPARGPDIRQPRGHSRGFDTHAVS